MNDTRAELLRELRALRERQAQIEAALGDAAPLGSAGDDALVSPESRPLRALAALQEALDGAPDEAALFTRACTVVVEQAGYARAWVGIAVDDEERTVRMVAEAGLCVGAPKAPIVWSDTERGRGPVGVAIRTGKPSVVQRTAIDPSFAPWRESAVSAGIAAVAALPIVIDGRAVGVLSVAAREEGAFSPRQLVLLVELSHSLSRACAALRGRAERLHLAAQLDRVLQATGVVAWSARAGSDEIEYVSGAAERVLGYTAEELTRSAGAWRSMVSAEDAVTLVDAVGDLVTRGRADIEVRVLGADGKERWVRTLMQADDPSSPGRIDGIAIDIGDRKRAEDALQRSEALFRRIVENGWQMISLTDEDGRITYAGGSWQQILGVDPSVLIGRIGTGLVHPDDEPTRRACRAAVHATPSATGVYEVRLRHADGHYVWCEINATNLLHDPSVRAIVTNARDVSERKRAELAAQRVHAELEQRVEDRTSELRRANEALSRASRIKDEFLAGMSHELRTPLNAVLGLSEALSEEVYGPLTERQRATMRRIEESGRHLLSLINDVLDLSKIEAGKSAIELGVVDVDDLCRASVRLVQEGARKKRLKISTRRRGGFGAVLADERRLKQVLVNLLSNAVKFTPDGGQIGLDVSLDEETSTLELAVWDSGIGMTPDEVGRLFQPFVQLDSGLARRHAGTGLGLALVRRLVDLHGGRVAVESTPGRGSRFTVTLPARRPSVTPARAASAVRRIARALVIDDSITDAEHLERYLAESGVEAILHATAVGAVDRAADEKPDVVFLDILLPDEVGWDLLSALKSDPRTAHVPVVVTTVLDRPPHASGADDFITKPVGRARVAEALTKIATSIETGSPSGLPAPGPNARRILVAEDEEANVDTVIDYLRSRGYDVIVARDGHEALTLTRAELPHLILMDIQMPVLDGLEATRAIRADPSPDVSRIPIIAVTALAMAGDRERCVAAGADDYLTKPVGLKALAAAVEAHLASAQL